MGTCCFTPKKTQFLWWYWLALASIIGIPMFLAARYVQRHQHLDPLLAGRRANRIFWGSSLLLMIGFNWFATSISGGYDQRYFEGYSVLQEGFESTSWLALEFVLLTLLANGVMNASRARKPFWKYLSFCGFILFLIQSEDDYNLTTRLLMMLISLLPAGAWQYYLFKPTRRTAWLALLAVGLGALLFCWAGIAGTREQRQKHTVSELIDSSNPSALQVLRQNG